MDEMSSGKLRYHAHCRTCGEMRWGIFKWIKAAGEFFCDGCRATTKYIYDGRWRPI